MKIVYTIVLIALSCCLFELTTLTSKAQVQIYPFKISMEEVNYEPIEVSKKMERTIVFTNTQAETFYFETKIEHPAFKRMTDSIMKVAGKSSVSVRYTFIPARPDTVFTKLTFRYSTEQNSTRIDGARAIPVKAIGLGPHLRAQIEVIDFGEVFIVDTARNSLLIRNIGNKTAEFKVNARIFDFNEKDKDFEIDSDFLNIPHRIEPEKEIRIPFKFFPNRVGVQEALCKLRIGDDNPKPGYEILANIKLRGIGIKRPPLVEIVTIPEKLSVSIGGEMTVPVSVNTKHLPEQVEKITMSGKIAFRDGTLGVITTDNTVGSVSNGRRVVEFEVPLFINDDLKGNIPIRFVGALGDSDTTDLSILDCRFTIGNVPIKSNVQKVSSTVTIEGFSEINGQKRILQSKGEGDVVIMADDPVFNGDISMKCIGLQRDADINIYDSGGNLVYTSGVKVTSDPKIFIADHTLNFGTYTAVLVYGTQYSTKRFIVVP